MNAKPIHIIEYQERWRNEFAEIGGKLRDALGESALRLDHIGSTSVPGLASKDIVDAQLTVASFDGFDIIAEALRAVGYVQRHGIHYDYALPETEPAQWEKRYFREPEGQRRTHLHVRVAGRANQRFALLFRDYLRARPNAALAYADTKRYMAHYHNQQSDPTLFYEIKGPVCHLIISAAEDWADRTGWTPGESEA